MDLLLADGQTALVDEADFPALSRIQWHRCAAGYVGTSLHGGGKLYLHRHLMQPSAGLVVDHVNRNKLDNRRCNLRVATRNQNAGNLVRTRSKFHSKFKGVTWSKSEQRWIAQLKTTACGREKNIRLGSFVHEQDAALAYDRAATRYFGNFARLNA